MGDEMNLDERLVQSHEERLLEADNQNLPRIKMLPNSSSTAASFEILDEDHTLGNALRFVIMRNPMVELCGYTIPHPSENKMNLRIQTFDGWTAFQALEQGLKDLTDLCNTVEERFEHAKDAFVS